MILHFGRKVFDNVYDSLRYAHLLDPNVGRMEEKLGNGKPLVVHSDDLLPGSRFVSWPDVSPPKCGKVRQDVVLVDWILLAPLLCIGHVLVEVGRDEAGVFLQLIDNVRFVHDIQLPMRKKMYIKMSFINVNVHLPVRNDIFEVICQHFPSDFNTLGKFGDFLALDVGDQVSETVTTINYQAAQL